MNTYFIGIIMFLFGSIAGLLYCSINNRKILKQVKDCQDVFHPDIHKLKDKK